jgi:beta-lactam-binding protein with PASTA domain
MKVCPSCKHENHDDVDFCAKPECRKFLDWERGSEVTATVATAVDEEETTAVITGPVVTGTRELVTLELLRADRTESDHALLLSVPAGGRAMLIARVRNQSDIVDSYRLTIEGLPDDWWTIDPPTAYLLPAGSRDGYEADIAIAVHPPRSSEAESRNWPFTVAVVSEKHPIRDARATAAIYVEPFWQIGAAVRPTHVAGRRGASLVVGVHNTGNVTVPIQLEALDAGGRCQFEHTPIPVDMPPGRVGEIPVVVRPKKTHWIGRPIDNRLDFVARSAHDPELKATVAATYRQRAWIPWWLPLALVMLALAAVILYLLWPDRVKVPDVRKQPDTFAAQKRLEKAGLTLNPKVETRLRPRTPAGTVIAQAPAPGKTVDKGKPVALVVASGHKLVRVPKLAGMKVTEAEQRLKARRLTLGAVQPKLRPDAEIAKQLPHAGARRRAGTPVAVVLAKPTPQEEKPAKKPGAATVPVIPPGASPAAAAAMIEEAGLVPVTELEIDPKKRGEVLRTVPAAGEMSADGTVKLIVSAGFPLVAYDDGRDALIVGGAAGSPRKGISARAEVAGRGAWTADGKRVAYVKEDRLYTKSLKRGAPSTRILTDGKRPSHPAFAPLLKRDVLVFATPDAKDHDPQVCWMDVTGLQLLGPSCREVSAKRIDGFAWSPRGTVLLVFAETDKGNTGLLRLATGTPFASAADQWTGGEGLVTPDDLQVRAAAFSPDAKRIAVVSNLRYGFFYVSIVAKGELGKLKKLAKPALLGCDVDWRPDGKELLVVQAGLDCGDSNAVDADGNAAAAVGPIVRAPVANPMLMHTVALMGRHPSYQPIGLSPGPGQAPVQGTRP